MSHLAGKISVVTFALTYLLVLVAVAAVLFVLGSILFGRGEELPALPKGTTATVLPAEDVAGADVDAVKFSLVFRGYKASEVDWVLDRLARQIDELRAELDEAQGARAGIEANAE
ncbi:DivIVA domain-containing protein [Mycolicibacterium phlei]|nr:cell division protein DivIVA [Mycobacteroides chelonae]ANA97479.1 cell division protein DivIVA [Mycobacteroides chelonae CCUG 47445]OLT75404.1 cell division protein DivIVA [Mycobacteroides chelonae]ORV13062.1 cell division protein DivIVA [Mycobacteroides chelonae]VEG15483.1 DivIVA domain-containing protein [Mycolicibacterium phlei]